MKFSEAMTVYVGLLLGNFTYQALSKCNWDQAFERSFFQLAAVVSVWSWSWLKSTSQRIRLDKQFDEPKTTQPTPPNDPQNL